MADTDTLTRTRRAARLGESAPRPDGTPKVTGQFAFGNDLWAEGMLWGRTLRSPHAHARIRSIDIAPALKIAGVSAVLTAEDVPGRLEYGLEHHDQPALARHVVRYAGEPVALVAADHPETARRAVAAIAVDYEVLEPLIDPEQALDPDRAPVHPDGNIFRTINLRHGDTSVRGDVVVEGTYEVGMQDQAFMGPEAGLAIPAEDGGVDLYVSTQWLHIDRDQVAACLALAPDKVRLTLAGVGGAFGAREDISLQIHLSLLALHTGRAVKMLYSREESFFGHVHRHPARMWYRHHASGDGRLVKVEARVLLDGGAYASSSPAVVANAVCFSTGPYRVPAAVVDGYAVRTNNPPCGAMRGFGAVQTCFGHESQMDKLAAALGIDPVELRLRNALATGDELITGQVITGAAPVAEVIRRCAEAPLPDAPTELPLMERPGGAGRTADQGDVRRGVGFAASFKNLMFSEGFDDYSTARVRIEHGVVTVHSACAEVGQGFVTLAQQIAREVLGLDNVALHAADTSVGSAGSTSASRQTWMSGGAVEQACQAVLKDVLADVARQYGLDPAGLSLDDDRIVSADGGFLLPVVEAVAGRVYDQTYEYHHLPTVPLDANGQGNAHVSYAFAAHRAVVDVDAGLGLVRVVDVTTAQDVGRVLNPLQAVGQIEGGIAQGVGLAVMEEIVVEGGQIRNPSFTDYLIPTALDAPSVGATYIEEPEPHAPFGAKGVGEPPTISSTPAVVAAIRAASGAALTRVPVRPDDIVG
jgi:xanthine dehydrogenase D subunit